MWDKIIRAATMTLKGQLSSVGAVHRGNIDAMNSAPSRMESRYDASREEYSLQAANSRLAVESYRRLLGFLESLMRGTFATSEHIGLGSVVHVRYHSDNSREWYLIAPETGGVEIGYDTITVRIVSHSSPIGEALIRHKIGETVTLRHVDETITIMDHLHGDGQDG